MATGGSSSPRPRVMRSTQGRDSATDAPCGQLRSGAAESGRRTVVTTWIIDLVQRLGVGGVGILMLAENVFPPLPSEVIMPLAGYLSARGEMDFWAAVAAGTTGSLTGAGFWYWVGRRFTHAELCGWVQRYGVWLAMTPDDVDRAV